MFLKDLEQPPLLTNRLLIFRVGTRLCGLPLEYVVETMRPMALEMFPGLPSYVMGISIIRGKAVPVLCVACLLVDEQQDPERFISIIIGERMAALAVGEVLGIRSVGVDASSELPPLLGELGSEVLAGLGKLDSELVAILQTGSLIPDSLWEKIEVAP